MNKLVSVIIPTYGAPFFLSRAISSVIGQDYPKIEIIIVDDNGRGSINQQKSEAIVRGFATSGKTISYISHLENKNGSAARNTGISKASGEYIALLDDDDYFLLDKIRLQVEEMDKSQEDMKICATWFRKLYKDGAFEDIKGVLYEDMSLAILLNKTMFPSSCLMFTKKVWEHIGGFDETFHRQQDVEFLIRACLVSKVLLVEKICMHKVTTNRNIPRNCDEIFSIFDHLLNKLKPIIILYDIDISKEIFYIYRSKIAAGYMSERKIGKAAKQVIISGKPVKCSIKLVKRLLKGNLAR